MSDRLHPPILFKVPSFVAKLSCLWLIIPIALVCDIGLAQPSAAQPDRKFLCERVNTIPTTVVKTMRGKIPMIRWVKSFSGRYHNLERRCTEVSARLDRFNRDGKLKFIRTGNVHDYPVLCADDGISTNTCENQNVLVTLPKGSDSAQILQQLLDLRARASGRIINLTGSQLVEYHNGDAYVNIDRLLGE